MYVIKQKCFGHTLMLPAKCASQVSDTTDILEDECHAYEHINILQYDFI